MGGEMATRTAPGNEGRLQRISLGDIDLEDQSFLVTYGEVPEKLLTSIRRLGVIHPVLLWPSPEGSLAVVCGSRRLQVLGQLGVAEVWARVLSPEVPPLQCLRLAVYDNASTRELNPVEKALVLAKASRHQPQAEVIGEYMPLVGLQSSPYLFDRYVALLDLEDEILAAVAAARLAERTAFALVPVPPADRRVIFDLFQSLPYSVNVQLELIEAVTTICRRDGSRSEEVVGAALAAAANNKSIPRRQLAQAVRQNLLARRYPRLTARWRQFRCGLRQIRLPAGVKVSPPPYFEGGTWRLECRFQAPEDLREQVEGIRTAAQDPRFEILVRGGGPG